MNLDIEKAAWIVAWGFLSDQNRMMSKKSWNYVLLTIGPCHLLEIAALQAVCLIMLYSHVQH